MNSDVILYLNSFVMDNSIFGCLRYEEYGDVPFMHSYAERHFSKEDAVGNKLISAPLCNDEEKDRNVLNIIEATYKLGNVPENGEIQVDYRLLKSKAVLDFLKRQHDAGHIFAIRILGKDYTLDNETYESIKYMSSIMVANSSVKGGNIFKTDTVRGYDDDKNMVTEVIVKHNIKDSDIPSYVEHVNSLQGNIRLSFRFYNPVMVSELVEKLDKAGLDKRIEIDLYGYALNEHDATYKKLEDISKTRKINVTYVCCHDLLNDYFSEPYAVNNSYQSELEPGARTTIDLYTKVLKFVEKFEESVKDVDSNIEKTMKAYQFLNEHFYYHKNPEISEDYRSIRDLDKIIDREDIVCVGYANLLTLLCRRVGIPMFTYAAPGHRMNIARIVEKDKEGNVILDKICTFDSTNDGAYYRVNEKGEEEFVSNKDSYTFFGLHPVMSLYDKNPSFLTLANALTIPPLEINNHLLLSKSPYQGSYSGGYTAYSYMYSMLRLMGYDIKEEEVPRVVAQLQRDNKMGLIPRNMILEAAKNIEKKKHPELNDEEFLNHMEKVNERINNSLNLRNSIYTSDKARIIEGEGETEIVTYRDKIDDLEPIDLNSIDKGPSKYIDDLDIPLGEEYDEGVNLDNSELDDYIAGTTIRKPRVRGIWESDEDYVNYLRVYYDKYFPIASKISDELNNGRERQDYIYSLTKDQIIQDLPLYSKEIQVFKTPGMTDEEIEEHRRLL